jgi:hypothetical protein
MRIKLKPFIYRAIWLGAFGSIVAISARDFGRPKSAVALDDRGRNGSVNSVLEVALGEKKCAERIGLWLDELPRGRSVLLVADPKNNRAGVTADLIPYLAWPRPVVVCYDLPNAAARLASGRDRFCAVGFCCVMPPEGSVISKSFGPALAFTNLDSH